MCPWHDADPIEDRVWGAVRELLGDLDKLTRLAREYLAIESDRVASQEDELAELSSRIARQEATLATSVTDYMRAGVDPGAMAAATRTLQDEQLALRRRRDDIERYRSDAEAQAGALDRAARMAQRAAGRLASMGPDQRAEVVSLLDIEVVALDSSRTPGLQIRDNLRCRTGRRL
jgi:hypothetical protein